MQPTRSDNLPLRTVEDLVQVRQFVRARMVEQGFGLLAQTKMVTAASELGRNTVVYGGGGSARIDLLADGERSGLRAVFQDQGPGIADIEQALRNGYTTGGGLGLGLGGAKRLVNEFEIRSAPGQGTAVTITMWTHWP
jgi:serine/threonine-protein kinase RsbT